MNATFLTCALLYFISFCCADLGPEAVLNVTEDELQLSKDENLDNDNIQRNDTEHQTNAPVMAPSVRLSAGKKSSPVRSPTVAEVYEPTKPSKKFNKKPPVSTPAVVEVSATTKFSKKSAVSTPPMEEVSAPTNFSKKSRKNTKKNSGRVQNKNQSKKSIIFISSEPPMAAPIPITNETFTCGSVPEDAISAEVSYIYNIDVIGASEIIDSIHSVEGELFQSMRDLYVNCEASSSRRRLSAVAGISAMPGDEVSGSCGADCTSIAGGMTFYVNDANDLTQVKCDLRKSLVNTMDEIEAKYDFITEIEIVETENLSCEGPFAGAGVVGPFAETRSVNSLEYSGLSSGAIAGIIIIAMVAMAIAFYLTRRGTKTDEASFATSENENYDVDLISNGTSENAEGCDAQDVPLIAIKELAGEPTGSSNSKVISETSGHIVSPSKTDIQTKVKRKTEVEEESQEAEISASLIATKATADEPIDCSSESKVILETSDHVVSLPEEYIHAKDEENNQVEEPNQEIERAGPLIATKTISEEPIESKVILETSYHVVSPPTISEEPIESKVILETSYHVVSPPEEYIHAKDEEKTEIEEPNQETGRAGSLFSGIYDESEDTTAVITDDTIVLSMSESENTTTDSYSFHSGDSEHLRDSIPRSDQEREELLQVE